MANESRGETTILDMESTVWNTVKDSGCTVVSKSGKTYKLPLNQIPIPTKTSELTNDSGFLKKEDFGWVDFSSLCSVYDSNVVVSSYRLSVNESIGMYRLSFKAYKTNPSEGFVGLIRINLDGQSFSLNTSSCTAIGLESNGKDSSRACSAAFYHNESYAPSNVAGIWYSNESPNAGATAVVIFGFIE